MSTTTYHILKIGSGGINFWIYVRGEIVGKLAIEAFEGNNFMSFWKGLNSGGNLYIKVKDFRFHDIDVGYRVFMATAIDWSDEKERLMS